MSLMAKKQNETYSKSLSSIVRQRLMKNRLAMLGMFIIAISIIIAFLGPLIRPDSTLKANDQIIEITTKKPGFELDVLKVRKNEKTQKISLWERILRRKENHYKKVPIRNYHFEGSKIVVEKYAGDDITEGQILTYNLVDVLYPIKGGDILESDGFLDFSTIDEDNKSMSIEELQQIIKEENIVHKKFLLGTDKYGRDLLSRLMAGTWISLSVGFISVFISLVIGITLGALAGFFRGWIDDFIIWIINLVWSIPTLLLVIAITLALGKDFWQVFVAVGLTMWVEVARVVRGQVLSIREKEFVEAGRALGFTNRRILFAHVIPNVLGPVIVISAINFAAAILIEAGLSYLGIGAQPPQATWGKMISEHKGYIITGDAYLAILPGVAIILMVFAFVLVGNGLRDALDSKAVDDFPTI